MFHIGQKVVCIKNGGWTSPKMFGDEIFPVFGKVYTVREIEPDFDEYSWIRLEEIINRPHNYGDGMIEASYRSDRFRPIVERKTDISVFTKMLTDNKIDA